MSQYRRDPAEEQLKEGIPGSGKYQVVGKLDQNVSAGVVDGNGRAFLHGPVHALVNADFGARADIQGNSIFCNCFLQARCMRENSRQGIVIGFVEGVGSCHKCVNAVCHGTLRHSQAPLDMGGSVIDTRQYVAVKIDQFSNSLFGLEILAS
jgi:hypothetical protein